MGRGSASKAMRQANRAIARGNIPVGANHSSVPGKKWTRKDVLRVRQQVQTDLFNGLIDNSHIKMEKSMKRAFMKQNINKKDISNSIKIMEALRSNTE